jgi:uncharacterized protein (DUF302 family)
MSNLISIDSKKTMEALREDLPRACAAHAFGVLGMHDLRAKLREKGHALEHETLVFEVCNPMQAKKVLDAHAEVATALPCRIAAWGVEGGTRLSTIRPTQLIAMFGAKDLASVASEVEVTLRSIMEEAAR